MAPPRNRRTSRIDDASSNVILAAGGSGGRLFQREHDYDDQTGAEDGQGRNAADDAAQEADP
jgi:hypothetical protein